MTAQARIPSWSCVTSPATHITLFLTSLESLVLSLYTGPHLSVSLPFLYHFLLLLPRRVSVFGHPRSGLRSAASCSCIMVLGRGHLWEWSLPPLCPQPHQACEVPEWCSIHLRLTSHPDSPRLTSSKGHSPRQGSFSFPILEAWCPRMTCGHLRVAPYLVPDWWLSQVPFFQGPLGC